MLNLGWVLWKGKEKENKKGNWKSRRPEWVMPILTPLSRQGPFGPVSRQGILCRDRACLPGAQPGQSVRDRPASAARTRVQ